ncbi:YbjN domain-containing protein [Coleofasciculus sp. LEGE 07092]|uniref:YbjN domain-containing protein n=1 Tax=Coleofasciculus sp. LEGE 07092 TaxID=2777969 RepID=UPI002AD3D327|nr:YbjN domain-containing protein [Coleofasciculus sp. LEGE 07092]
MRAVNLALTKQVDKISECRLSFQVNPELYKRIDTETLFNLKPEIRSPLSSEAFQTSPDIQIEVSLDPTLLPQLAKHATDANQVATYLQHLSREQPKHPILSIYSWYTLQVKQEQETGETGYRTLWAYLKPSFITQDGIDNEKLNEAMNNFAKEWVDTNGSEASQSVISEAIEEMTKTFEELTNSISEMTEEVVSETIEEMSQAFAELTDSISDIAEEVTSAESLFETIINFFKEQDWQFQPIQGQQTLRLAFQGKNGKWDCYARVREHQQQFVFYSICPVKVTKAKRRTLGEFIARANYGMIIGNFELSFDDGEIRYKTSIDIQDSLLSLEAFKQLVYTNVLTVDKYLPGIISVVSGEMSPAEAIAQIESALR